MFYISVAFGSSIISIAHTQQYYQDFSACTSEMIYKCTGIPENEISLKSQVVSLFLPFNINLFLRTGLFSIYEGINVIYTAFITGFVTRLTRRVPLVEQELLTFPKHLSSSPVFSEIRVPPSLVLYVCFVDRCLSFCTFSFVHCVVCSSSIYGFWLPLWYLQTLLNIHLLYLLDNNNKLY